MCRFAPFRILSANTTARRYASASSAPELISPQAARISLIRPELVADVPAFDISELLHRIPEQLPELFGTWGPDHECADRRHLPRLRDGSERAESHGGTDKREEFAAAYRA